MSASAKNSLRGQNVAAIEAAKESARQVADVTRQAAEATQETIRTAIDTASQAMQTSAGQFGARSVWATKTGKGWFNNRPATFRLSRSAAPS